MSAGNNDAGALEVVDELMTPGCPNCAKKHLSAAVERVVDGFNPAEYKVIGTAVTMLARAYINLVEAAEGYSSHRDYAFGLLVAAEERLVRDGVVDQARAVRGIRTGLMTGTDSLETLYCHCADRLAVAHVYEAFRELPALSEKFNRNDFGSCDQQTVDWLVSMIRWIDKEFFSVPDEPEKGGDSTMATKTKKPAFGKKADPKAAKAACKGGKCSKKGCK